MALDQFLKEKASMALSRQITLIIKRFWWNSKDFSICCYQVQRACLQAAAAAPRQRGLEGVFAEARERLRQLRLWQLKPAVHVLRRAVRCGGARHKLRPARQAPPILKCMHAKIQ